LGLGGGLGGGVGGIQSETKANEKNYFLKYSSFCFL